jgi:hypothetical protein
MMVSIFNLLNPIFNMKKIIRVSWEPKQSLLSTTLCGRMDEEDIAEWKEMLQMSIDAIPDDTLFRLLANFTGVEAVNANVHAVFRMSLPHLLAQYDCRLSFLNLFPETAIELSSKRGIRCRAIANVVEDAARMGDYDYRFASEQEGFFNDLNEALQWLNKVTATKMQLQQRA